MDLDLATVDRLLSTTRSVRKRLDLTRPVRREIVTECIRLATQAPTAADAQNWHWVAVEDAGKRRAIADIHRAANEEFARGEVALLGPGAALRRMDSALYLIEHLHEVPVHVLAYVLDPHLEALEGQPPPPAAFYGSIFPAVWSFQLALRSRGLGSVLTTLHLAREREAAELLGIPDGIIQAGLLPVAYSTGDGLPPCTPVIAARKRA